MFGELGVDGWGVTCGDPLGDVGDDVYVEINYDDLFEDDDDDLGEASCDLSSSLSSYMG